MDGVTDRLPFLMNDVSRLMRRRFDERARMIGVTRAQWRVLSYLNRGEGINQGGLAEYLEVEPITLCRMIDRLEDAGLVERRRDPSDRRAWQLYLTDRARPLLDDLGVIADDLVRNSLLGVSVEAHDDMVRALERMHRNLSDPIGENEAAHG